MRMDTPTKRMESEKMNDKKPLGRKNYGSIPHLSQSRLGIGDHHCNAGQERIATVKTRNKNDEVFVQEKLDGSNVGVARIDDRIYPISRAGYHAISSPYEQHHHFDKWARDNQDRFLSVLNNGERIVGEWLMVAHGTKYKLIHEPFVAFDIMTGANRITYDKFISRVCGVFVVPKLLWRGGSFSVSDAIAALGDNGFHGAMETPEGAIWRVETRKPTGIKGEFVRSVSFLVKYVRPNKVDGKYLSGVTGGAVVLNE